MKCFRSIAIAVVSLAAVRFAPAQSAKIDPANWAPTDAVFFLGFADTEQFWTEYKKTAGYALMQDPAAKGIASYNVVNIGLEKFKSRLGKALSMPADQIKSPFKGPLALYFTAVKGGEGEQVEPGLVAGIGDGELMKKYYDAAVKKMKEAADKYESVSAGTNTIDVFETDPSKVNKKSEGGEDEAADDDEDDAADDMGSGEQALTEAIDKGLDELFSKEAMPKSIAFCLTSDRLFVGQNADTIKAALRQEKSSGAGSLAETDDYKAMGREFKPLGNLRFMLNIPRLAEMARAGDEDAAKQMTAMGIKCMRSLIGHIDMGAAEYDGKFEALLMMTGDKTGIAKILSMENRSTTPGGSVSADAVMFASINLNILKMVDEVERIMRQTDPDMADQMHAGMESVPLPSGETMNVRKDVLENLREPLTFMMGFTRPYGPDSARLLTTLGHKNKAAIEKLFGLAGGFLMPRDLRGTQVYDAPMGGISVAATNDQIVMGNTAAVESALTAEKSEGLAGDASFKKAAKLAPAEAWGTIYVDTRRMMEAIIAFEEKQKDIEAAAAGGNAGAGIAQMLAQSFGQVSEGKIEEARKLLKYYAPQIVTMATTSDGLRITSVQLKPEKE